MHNHYFKDKNKDIKLSEEELIRAIRHSIADEYDAIALYETIAENTTCEQAKKLFEEVVEDEKEHVGNFLKLLEIKSPEEIALYKDGAKETEDIIEND